MIGPVSRLLALALLVGTPVTAGLAPRPAQAATTRAASVSVDELDLSGVDRAALEDLPAQAPPVVEDAALDVVATPSPTTAPAVAPAAASTSRARVTTAAWRTTAADAPPATHVPATPSATATPPATTTTPTPSATPSVAAPSTTPDAAAPAATPPPTGPQGADADGPAPDPDVLTGELDTAPFSVLGVSWDETRGLSDPVIRYRVRQADRWSDWEAVGQSDLAPDAGGADDRAGGHRGATDPVVALHADGLQIWAEAATGSITGLKAVLIDPGEDPADAAANGASSTGGAVVRNASLVRRTSATVVPTAAAVGPAIITRAAWGADESLRTCNADLAPTTLAAAVHHTASTNDYGPDDVPGLLRGFLEYHTRPEAAGGRGWCDLGYNFLVDKFGRVFEGRAGSITKAVIGVHTGGFNSRTIGIAAIGDYSTAAPSGAMLESLSQLISWKFKTFRILGGSAVTMVSGGGASKYPEGTVVTFPTIYAHRDAQLTSCPGQNLFDQLPYVRARVAALANDAVYASPIWSLDSFGADSSAIYGGGWVLDPESTESLEVTVTVDGVDTRFVAGGSRPDLAGPFPGNGTLHGFSFRIPAPGGSHEVCLTARNVGAGNDVMFGCDWKTVTNAAPFGSLDAVSSTSTSIRVAGWALDPDTTAPVVLHVYLRDSLTAITADGYRPDVDAVFHKGPRHGFDATLPASPGVHNVCVYAINQPVGVNQQLGCRTVQVGSPPVGVVDSAAAGNGVATVTGWAFDPDTSASVGVHVYVDGAWATATTAATPRPDVAAAYRISGDHGYAVSFPIATGTHRVCLYAIDTSGGYNPEIGCRLLTVTNAPPIGVVDSVVASGGQVTVRGWAFDPDTSASISVHVFVDGGWRTATTAATPRPDVSAVYRIAGDHGYGVTLPVAAGSHRVCAYAIDSAGGYNPEIGCRMVTVG
ncbi:N-acetylmuramoyl-L-alanine amidase [Cellulomonas sp.]|uniref:N-acetylmuramoyl-L-alanine amidase n=1 Tax=Cellulomonas sp. TaxID=40001 RepID=UPI001B158CB1|nr:N-acetylmuramoyl-L-alanine amidase [Cellulomonas sp.]MBO9555490.1 N-acetylmuramoyl-L-alanine amidase [Cellulomonas sp.]